MLWFLTIHVDYLLCIFLFVSLEVYFMWFLIYGLMISLEHYQPLCSILLPGGADSSQLDIDVGQALKHLHSSILEQRDGGRNRPMVRTSAQTMLAGKVKCDSTTQSNDYHTNTTLPAATTDDGEESTPFVGRHCVIV